MLLPNLQLSIMVHMILDEEYDECGCLDDGCDCDEDGCDCTCECDDCDSVDEE